MNVIVLIVWNEQICKYYGFHETLKGHIKLEH